MKWSFTYSHKGHGVSNLRQLSCVFNNLFKLTVKKEIKFPLLVIVYCDLNPHVAGLLPSLFYDSIMPYHLTHVYLTTTSALYIAGLSICKFPFTAQTHQYFPGNTSIGHCLWCCKHIRHFWYNCIIQNFIDRHVVTSSTSITFSCHQKAILVTGSTKHARFERYHLCSINWDETYSSLDVIMVSQPKPELFWVLTGAEPIFSIHLFSLILALSNAGYPLNTMDIFDRCRHSWAAVKSVIYKGRSKNLACIFVKQNNPQQRN